jgi:hypothetical protein
MSKAPPPPPSKKKAPPPPPKPGQKLAASSSSPAKVEVSYSSPQMPAPKVDKVSAGLKFRRAARKKDKLFSDISGFTGSPIRDDESSGRSANYEAVIPKGRSLAGKRGDEKV